MKKIDNYKYCEKTTTNHPISKKEKGKFCQQINDILKLNGGNGILFGCYKAINLDDYKDSLKIQPTPKSVDMVLGISKNGQGKSPKVLMVELKLNVKKLTSIKISDIKRKIEDSKNLLSNSVSICTHYYVVFNKQQINDAKSYFRQLRELSVIEENSLFEKYFNDFCL